MTKERNNNEKRRIAGMMALNRAVRQMIAEGIDGKYLPELPIDYLKFLEQYGVAGWNAKVREKPDIIPDFSSANLSKKDLASVNFNNANLILADLTSTNFSGAFLRNAKFTKIAKVTSEKFTFTPTRLSKVNFSGAHLEGAYFDGANLEGANFKGAHLGHAFIASAKLRGARLEGAHLEGADLSRSDLTNANLEGANLTDAYFQESNLENTTLSGSTVHNIHIIACRLKGIKDNGLNIAEAGREPIVCNGILYAISRMNIMRPEMNNPPQKERLIMPEIGRRAAQVENMGILKGKKVFLSYKSLDKAVVEVYYDKLKTLGATPWMASRNIPAGSDWASEILRAEESCDFAIIFISSKSVEGRGVIQEEIKQLLSINQRNPEGRIFLIPVRLDDCQIPQSLRQFHCVDLFEADGFDKIVKGMTIQMKRSRE